MSVPKKVAGVDVLLKVKNGASFVVLGGQTGATLNREAETIDVTDKTSSGFKTSIAGLISWSVDCDGFVVLGDQAFELLETAFLSRQAVEVEIRIGANDDTDGVTYSGSGYIVDMPLEFSQDDAVTYALSIEGASPLARVKGVVS
jgi:TP901-1 family phage major tail protein